jgi:hypothetical protein
MEQDGRGEKANTTFPALEYEYYKGVMSTFEKAYRKSEGIDWRNGADCFYRI